MPRNRARFSGLIRELRTAGGTPAAGTRAAGFKLWLENQSKVEVKNKVSSKARKRFRVAIVPFGMDVDADFNKNTKVIVTASAYSLSGMTRITLTDAEAGHLGDADAAGATVLDGFYPALVCASVTREGAALDPTKKSGITGKNYPYLPVRNFRIPFGRIKTGANQDFYTRAKALKDELQGKVKSLSFQEENFTNAFGSGAKFNGATDAVPVN